MTVDELVQYYLDLIILQYRNKSKALGTIDAFVRPAIMDNIAIEVQNAFNIETAVGAQLDILGKYIGAERRVLTFSGAVTLGDADYRTLLKIKIAINGLGSSLYDIQNFIVNQASNILQVFDHQTMQMSFYINSNYASLELAQALVRQNLLPKPMGVSFSSIVYLPDLSNIFGMQTYEYQGYPVSAFNSMEDFHADRPFIDYENAL